MRAAVVPAALAAALAAAAPGTSGCGDNVPPTPITIHVAGDDDAVVAALEDLAALTGYPRLAVVTTAQPAVDAAAGAAGFHVAVVAEATCAECYRLDDPTPAAQVVHAGDLLGAQYGVAHALERLGFRFRSPYATYAPTPLRRDPTPVAGVQAPETRVRGFQLHTIHPTEAYFAFWEPGDDHLAEARRVIDWTVKNRGNYVQWVALDDIMDPARHAAWKPHTQAILAYARARGVRTGVNLQLYGQSNLQRAFDLWDDRGGGVSLAASLAARLPLLTDGLPFDVYALSFGEFFNSEPARFIADVDAVSAALLAHAPAAELHAVVHVGADQRVEYQGEDLIYYFLVKFADPRIVPDVHTVMFYNLYEDAGGAYHHDDFAEHRAYLLERIAAGQPAAYFPETAYWVSFDVSVPIYLPLYVRNRWLDLERLRADPAAGGNRLDNHLLFSSGWEWGYWLHDYTALRASYRLAPYQELVADALGDDLAPAVPVVVALIELQKRALMDERLMAYLAGRDQSFEVGRNLGIVSQPDRVTFDDLVTADATTRTAVAADTERLLVLADELDRAVADLGALRLIESRWSRELRDGARTTALRARFAAESYRAMLAHLDGRAGDARAHHDLARRLVDDAAAVVARRHRDLHHPRPAQIVGRGANATFYAYGYLQMADTVCFWVRELRQVAGHAGLPMEAPPDCVF